MAFLGVCLPVMTPLPGASLLPPTCINKRLFYLVSIYIVDMFLQRRPTPLSVTGFSRVPKEQPHSLYTFNDLDPRSQHRPALPHGGLHDVCTVVLVARRKRTVLPASMSPSGLYPESRCSQHLHDALADIVRNVVEFKDPVIAHSTVNSPSLVPHHDTRVTTA